MCYKKKKSNACRNVGVDAHAHAYCACVARSVRNLNRLKFRELKNATVKCPTHGSPILSQNYTVLDIHTQGERERDRYLGDGL